MNGIAKYIEFWQAGMARDAKYSQHMAPYVSYWKQIHELISGPLPSNPTILQEGFWPRSGWIRDHARASSNNGDIGDNPDITPKDDPDRLLFCGPQMS